jgi:aconitate hydratase 2 / 2-methylisocitrate dehydratase
MSSHLTAFAKRYTEHLEERANQGIPPLPLTAEQTAEVVELLGGELPADAFRVHGQADSAASLRYLVAQRVPPGVYPASKVKAAFLAKLLTGEVTSPHLDASEALTMLGAMGGGFNVAPLLKLVAGGGEMAATAARLLEDTILVTPDDVAEVKALAAAKNDAAVSLLKGWAEASWFSHQPEIAMQQRRLVIRTSEEINTDFYSPAQHASTRDDIPLHALSFLSTSPHDQDFLDRRKALNEKGVPFLYVGDVVGTGSSRKSASNSLVWWIGEDIPSVPNKRRGGLVFAAKIAPIFFNTLRGCGAIPVRCSTGDLQEGMEVVVDLAAGEVRSDAGKVLSKFEVSPASIFDEARAGGRNNLIIGRKLTLMAAAACNSLGIDTAAAAISPTEPASHPAGTQYTLAQKLVGEAAKISGVLPGDYVEPQAQMVFSQDTTGRMTQQEILELATLRFAAPTIQSFCHTAAGPRSKDASMQGNLGAFIAEMGGIDLRPGDGVIHTNGNRFLLPHYVGTGGDSHTRFPIGISFPAGSDLVAFASSQGYLPLDMPESVRVRFKGKMQPGITIRDLVNAIPYAAMQQGKLNLDKGDAKRNVFADRILEIEGLESLSVEDAFKLTDASAERSAAAATFKHDPDKVVAYVENNLRFLKNNFSKRHSAKVVHTIIAEMEAWLKEPRFLAADGDANYADTIDVDLDTIKEPLLAAPNDPDKVVALSQVAGTQIDEVFVGSCMTDISDFRAVAGILKGQQVQHQLKVWTVPPDRESNRALAKEGVHGELMESGANVHVPGCSLCMGNQGQVANGATVLSTSTRNFNNRLGVGAQVFLGSAQLAAVTTLTGELPSVATYLEHYARIADQVQAMAVPLQHA